MTEKVDYCTFCGKSEHEVAQMVGTGGSNICNECVALCAETMANTQKQTGAASPTSTSGVPLKPTEIHQFLNDYVIGQDKAKMVLAVAMFNHYKRLNHLDKAGASDVELQKSNILLIGPTGSGKTLLAQTLARLLDVPFAIADATTLTEAGYVGDDVESVLAKLIQNADGDVKKAERGIIYIDEIDKISRRSESASITRDVSGEGVQQALLKLIEGTVSSVPPGGGRKNPAKELQQIDTKNILFICGGAFDGIEKLITQRSEKGGMGFSATVAGKSEQKSIGDLLDKLETGDLIRFGLIPELIGRLPMIACLRDLDEDALVRILTEPKNSIVAQYKALFAMDGVDLEIEQESLHTVAKLALARKTGARGLRSILEDALLPIMYEAPAIPDLERVIVPAACITEKAKPTYVKRELPLAA